MIGKRQAGEHQDADDGDDPDRTQPRPDPVRPPADHDAAHRAEQLRHRDKAPAIGIEHR